MIASDAACIQILSSSLIEVVLSKRFEFGSSFLRFGPANSAPYKIEI
jgi:hypothetical protein